MEIIEEDPVVLAQQLTFIDHEVRNITYFFQLKIFPQGVKSNS